MATLQLKVLPYRYAVCQLAADAPLPVWAFPPDGGFASVSRTDDELSVICRQDNVPERVRAERGWRCFKVEGPLVFDAVGIMAGLTGALAAASVPVFAVSTYDTDYILVKDERLAAAVEALRHRGYRVAASPEQAPTAGSGDDK